MLVPLTILFDVGEHAESVNDEILSICRRQRPPCRETPYIVVGLSVRDIQPAISNK